MWVSQPKTKKIGMKNQILLYGNTRKSSDILYFSGFSVHDDYFFFSLNGKKCALLSPLEIGRARRTSSLDKIFLNSRTFYCHNPLNIMKGGLA